MKVVFLTLGCKTNQVETEGLKEQFRRKGFEVLPFYQPHADIYIVNTCTVTHVSDRKSKSLLRRLIRNNPRAMVVATGCLAQMGAEQLAGLEGIAMVIGNQDKERLAQLVMEKLNRPGPSVTVMVEPFSAVESLKPVYYQHHQSRYRGMVKIQDGCDSFCSYCIVPYARGPVRSKAPQDVVQEILPLARLGYQEIVLTGIHIGTYGKDLKGWDLTGLLTCLLEQIPPPVRIRLGSMEPLEVKDALLELFKQNRRLCRHLHIPLQSGSDKILKSMNRHYTGAYYQDLVAKITTELDDVAVSSDVMVGFPDENRTDFLATQNMVRDLPLSMLHVFKYSQRPGTPAAQFPRAVTEAEKNWRSAELLQLSAVKNEQFRQQQIGKTLKVLVDKKLTSERYRGLSENYLEVEFYAEHDYRGKLVMVQMKNAYEGMVC